MTKLLSGLLLLAGLAAIAAPASAYGDSRRVPLSYEQPELTRAGNLDWRGGIELTSDTEGFGGLSALDISADGRVLTALTDRGRWIRFSLEHDARGHLVAARLVAQAPLNDTSGRPFRQKHDRDSEGLARLPDGSLLVSFESRHRLLRYPAAVPDFSAPPVLVTPPRGLGGISGNGGIEALTPLADGWLLALTEKQRFQDGTLVGWAGNGSQWWPLRYVTAPEFHPTGATTLPGSDIIILERRFSAFGGFAARLVRVTAAAVKRSAANFGIPLKGQEIGRLEPPLNIDNFEGIAVRRGTGGETLVYLVSDDNFFALQRTLLLVFAVQQENGPVSRQ